MKYNDYLVLQCKCISVYCVWYVDIVVSTEDKYFVYNNTTKHNTTEHTKTPMIVKKNTDIMTLNYSGDLEYLSMDVNLYSGEA